jgi:hypothetical protein
VVTLGLSQPAAAQTPSPTPWATSADGTTISNTNPGNVGIGTATPLFKLHVFGEDTRVESSNYPRFSLNKNNVGTDQGRWQMYAAPGGLNFSALNDAENAETFWMRVMRGAGTSISNVVFPNGNVGIGTTNPAANSRLDISGGGLNIGGLGNLDAALHIKSAYGGYDRLTQMSPSLPSKPALNLIASTDAGGGGQWWVWGVDANVFRIQAGTAFGGSGGLSIDSAGNVTVSGNLAAKYQDVAEWVQTSQTLAAGTVVVLDTERTNQVLASTESYDTKVAGVVSAQPGLILGESGEGKVKVATTGRVRVRVDATKAPIKVGDLLVTSNEAGVAMRSEPLLIQGRRFHSPGTLIGKALEPLASGTGEILVLLSLQ